MYKHHFVYLLIFIFVLLCKKNLFLDIWSRDDKFLHWLVSTNISFAVHATQFAIVVYLNESMYNNLFVPWFLSHPPTNRMVTKEFKYFTFIEHSHLFFQHKCYYVVLKNVTRGIKQFLYHYFSELNLNRCVYILADNKQMTFQLSQINTFLEELTKIPYYNPSS